MNSRSIPGVRFVPVTFTPTSSRYANQLCNGVAIIILDRYVIDGPELGIEIASALHKLYPNDFQMEKMIELLCNQAAYDAIARGDDPRHIAGSWRDDLDAFKEARQKYLIYPESARRASP